jgi:hypothetical protein
MNSQSPAPPNFYITGSSMGTSALIFIENAKASDKTPKMVDTTEKEENNYIPPDIVEESRVIPIHKIK